MNRPIKFRAWDKEEKRWDDDTLQGIAPDGGFIFALDDDMPHEMEVSLFTGLTDKNGKEIYEGDFVKLSKKMAEPWIIGWNEPEGRWCFVYTEGEVARNIGAAEVKLLEVIGNIYENPELLSV